jgi:HSP20 family protein
MRNEGLVPRTRDRAPALRPFSWDLSDFDRLFDAVSRSFAGSPWEGDARFAPRVDIAESEEAFHVTAELPGLEEKDFDVSLENHVLTIKGEKRQEHEVSEKGYRHVETVSGRFERRFHVPADVDPDAVTASYRNGVLTVTLPKAETARPRAIPVSSA